MMNKVKLKQATERWGVSFNETEECVYLVIEQVGEGLNGCYILVIINKDGVLLNIGDVFVYYAGHSYVERAEQIVNGFVDNSSLDEYNHRYGRCLDHDAVERVQQYLNEEAYDQAIAQVISLATG